MKKLLSVLCMLLCLSSCTEKVPVCDCFFMTDFDSFRVIGYTNLDKYFEVKSTDCKFEDNNFLFEIELEKNDEYMECDAQKLKYFKYTETLSLLTKFRYTFYAELYDNDEDKLDARIKFLNADKLFEKELEEGDTFTLEMKVKIKESNKKIESVKEDGLTLVLIGMVNENKKVKGKSIYDLYDEEEDSDEEDDFI